MSYAQEVDMIAEANKLDLLTTPYVFNPENAKAMAEAGADILVCHMGLTAGGAIGARSGKSLEDCVPLIDQCIEAAREIRKDIITLCHGGPIADPEDARFILDACPGCHGFYGASSMERLPTERAIEAQALAFKAIRRRMV